MKIIDKIAWIHIKDRRMLFVRAQGKTEHSFPGGKREDGETDLEALARELREELGITLKLETAQLVGVYRAPALGRDDLEIQSTCYTGKYSGTFSPGNEIVEFAWRTSRDTEGETPMTQLVLADLKKTDLID